MKLNSHVIHVAKVPRVENGKLIYDVEERDVILMAIAGNWAMVRRPRCIPYATEVSELKERSSSLSR